MLKKTERLNHRLFAEFFNKGKRKHNTYTTIISSPHPHFLCAVVVGKKVAKKAHDRNRLKRQVYSIIEKLKTEEVSGVYIVILKPAVVKLTKAEFREVIDKEVGLVLNKR